MKNAIPILTIAVLIALASFQTTSGQEDVNAGDVNAGVVQNPCDNVTQHMENVGVIISGNYIKMGKELPLDFGGVPVIIVPLKNETMDERYYVNCISGEVHIYDELAGYLLSDPILSKIDRQIRFEAKFRPKESKFRIVVSCLNPTEEKKRVLESLGMDMYEPANERAYTPYMGYATNETIHKIAELDFVTRITLNELIYGLTGGGVTESDPSPQRAPSTRQITLIANSIDYSLAKDFIAFLQNKTIEVVHINASDFDQHNSDEFVVILGGPDAPEGVGEIVQQVLTREEQDSVREPGSRKMFIKENVWADGQAVYVIAGSDRNQTKLATDENLETVEINVLA